MSTGPSFSKFTAPSRNIFTSVPGEQVHNPLFSPCATAGAVLVPSAFADVIFPQYQGRLYEPLPTSPKPPTPPPRLPPRKELEVSRLDGFKKINSLPPRHITGTPDAMERLVHLKQFINALQEKRESYWTRQGVTAGLGLGLSIVTFGGSAIAGGVVGVQQGDRLDTIKFKIRQAIAQINNIRSVYGDEEHWEVAEAKLRINSSIFNFGIESDELHGDL